jgi:ketosteroid isomerase-like protein
VVSAYLAARDAGDVAGVRALFADQAVVDLTGQRVEVRTLHFDSEIRHWLLQAPRQLTPGPLRVVGERVTWHEQVVDNEVQRLPGVPAAVREEDAEAIVQDGKITSLTYTVAPAPPPPGSVPAQPTDSATPSTGGPPQALSFGALVLLALGAPSAWWLAEWRRRRRRR